MADDAHKPSDESATVQLDIEELEEVGDIEELEELPEFPNREEFVKTLEMDSSARDSGTNPMQAVLDMTTQRYDVPDQLLEAARRSQVVESEDWREFIAVVDQKGRIALPSSVHRRLRGKKIRVRFTLEE